MIFYIENKVHQNIFPTFLILNIIKLSKARIEIILGINGSTFETDIN